MSETVVQEISNYRILKSKSLGQGACGQVYYGQSKAGIKVAVKSIDINKLTDHIEKQIKSEITTLKELASPYIVKMYDCFRSGEHLYIVLEYCEDGDLKRYLDANRKNGGISEAEALTFMRHLMNGYSALLSRKVIHRDIKPANILLKQGVAKLSDFGFSRVVEDPTKTQKLSCLGTPLYTAPEVLARQEFSNSCDIWSMGVVFYEMLHGRPPWTGSDIENLYYNIKNVKLEFKANVRPAVKDVISRMLTVERHKRISWQQLLKNPLFAKPIDLEIEKKVEMGYQEAAQHMLNYLNNYLVKSYLLLNINDKVQFAPNQEPLDELKKSPNLLNIQKETGILTLRRNFAFLHIYVLALYWRNRGKKLLPEQMNYFMEFQYGLIGQALDLISQIGRDFTIRNKQKDPEWIKYSKSPQYIELSQLLEKDYTLLTLLFRACRKEMEAQVASNRLHSDTLGYLKKYDQSFSKVFNGAMKFNLETIEKDSRKTGVSKLIGDYIKQYILIPSNILNNMQLLTGFASFYESRQRQFGLN